MSFRGYMRWDGWVAIVAGAGLFGYGLALGHQGLADALSGGLILILGTAIFMRVRHKVALREPGAWFTEPALAAARREAPPCSRGRLLGRLLCDTAIFAVAVVGLSYLTGFWLTYMDFGVWGVVIGAIKVGPAAAAIEQHEASSGISYRVARRPARGLVRLTAA